MTRVKPACVRYEDHRPCELRGPVLQTGKSYRLSSGTAAPLSAWPYAYTQSFKYSQFRAESE